ncbi:hypothetical protein F5141DRAFT_1068551 [Pisolithus sp. B1]|nr:hypothetical protein F5141DRAFT_1068551 [Pisolithus sp. B1]
MLHYYSSHEILITPSTLPQKGTDDPRDKRKSKAQESEISGGDSDTNEDSDLVQVSVSMDNAIILPLPTPQLSKERGYDMSIGNLLSEDSPWSAKVWIISGPSKGYRGMLRSTAPPPHHATLPPSLPNVNFSVKSGPSTSTYNPWVINSDNATPQCPNEMEQGQVVFLGFSMTISVTIPIDISGQYCLVLRGELAGQIFWVKKCQSKKELRGVELEDGTKLHFGDAEALICSSPNDKKFIVTFSEVIGIIEVPALKLDAVGSELADNNTFYFVW